MTTPWAEVAANPSFKMLPPEKQEAARNQYFAEVVAPKVPAEQVQQVKAQFDADTRLSFGSTGGGAATGNPRISMQADKSVREGKPTIGERGMAIGGATALGGAMGAFAPELLTAAGGAAAAFPFTAPAAPVLFGMGNLARGSRVAGGVTGAISGFGSEVAGQSAEAAGAGPMTAEAARLAGGLTPEFKNMALYGVKKAMGMPIINDAANFLKVAVQKMGGGDPAALTAAQKEYLDGLIANVRGGAKSDAAAQTVYGALDRGAQQKQARAAADAGFVTDIGAANAASANAASERVASGILSNAEATSQGILSAAKTGPIAKREAGLLALPKIAETAMEAARGRRLSIGNDAEVSNIGDQLRKVVVGRQGAAIEARNKAYQETVVERDAVVKAKEDAGVYLESLPAYKDLLKDIDSKLLLTKKAQDAATGDKTIGKADVTEQGVRTAYQRIYDAVHRRRIPTGEVNEAGNPTYKEFATSFEAIDDVRRKLGDVLKGSPGEGYESISKEIARKYYAKISDIQKEFAGESQAKLQSEYADAMGGLAQFNSKTGKRFTALDRYDDTEFKTDAAKLPKQFFTSRQGVQDLIELTGDKALVTQAARDYATNALRDKGESQVRTWMTANKDWLSAMPDVYLSVNKYADSLARGERVARNAGAGIKRVEKDIGIIGGEAERQAKGVLSQGEREVKGILSQGERTSTGILSNAQKASTGILAEGDRAATQLTGNKFPVERVRQLIESGDPTQWKAVAPVIAKDPAARGAIIDAVRQTLADRAERSTAGLTDFYARNVRPALEQSGLVTTTQADNLAKQLAQIQNLKLPESEKLGMANRLLAESLAGYSASKTADTIVDAKRERRLVDQIPK